MAGILLSAAATTTIVGIQIAQPANPWRGFILPMLELSLLLATQAFLIAHWLSARPLGMVRWLIAYVVMLSAAAFLTLAIATALYPGS